MTYSCFPVRLIPEVAVLSFSTLWVNNDVWQHSFYVRHSHIWNSLPVLAVSAQEFSNFNPRPHLLFRHPRTHVGGVVAPPPRLVCPHPPLIEIELCNKNKWKDLDVVNLTIPDFTTLDNILTFPGQVKEKMLLFWEDQVFANIFEVRKVVKNAKHHRIPLIKKRGNKYILNLKGHSKI